MGEIHDIKTKKVIKTKHDLFYLNCPNCKGHKFLATNKNKEDPYDFFCADCGFNLGKMDWTIE